MTCHHLEGGIILCVAEMREVHRERDGDERWCFACRKLRPFDYVVQAPVDETSYYGPHYSIRCAVCDMRDGDLFPGNVREWES
jgi:hypothetical protein